MTGIAIRSTGVCTDRSLPKRNPLWDPSFLTTRRKLHLDARLGAALDGTSELVAWTDQAQGKVLTQSAGDGAMDTYDFNGVAVPRFTLDGYSTADAVDAVAGYRGFWAVVDVINTDAVQQNLLHSNGLIVYRSAAGNWRFGGFSANAWEPGPSPAGKQIVILYTAAAGVYNCRVNGAQIGNNYTTSVVESAQGQTRVGAYDPGMRDTAIASIGTTSGIVTLTEVLKMEGHLAHRFGLTGLLPANHPYKAKAPRKLDA